VRLVAGTPRCGAPAAAPRGRARRARAAASGLARVAATALALALPAAAGCGPRAEPPPPARGIVLVVLDTLRADGLSAYGNPRPTSPAIDALAARGALFEHVVSHASWTLPGFIGLLSGRYPSTQVFAEGKLRSSFVEALRDAGRRTAAFTESGYVSRHFGVDRGFETFQEEQGKTHLVIPGASRVGPGSAERTFEAAIAWLRAHDGSPFFLMVHTYEPHMPYRAREYAEGLPSGTLGRTYEGADRERVRKGQLAFGETERAYVRALYDGGVRSADRQLERLLAALEETGLAGDTAVIVTSDHGEDLGHRSPRALGEHGHHLYDEVLRVPLVVYHPRAPWPARRIGTQVRLVDVGPTILELAGVEPPPGLSGRSLVPVLAGAETEPRVAFSELRLSPWNDHPRAAMRDARWKLIANLPPRAPGWAEIEFYDLAKDPGERENLIGLRSEALDRLAAGLEAQRRALGREGELALPDDRLAPPDLREQLEALGYVDGGAR